MTMAESESDSEDDYYCSVGKAGTINHMAADDEDGYDLDDEYHHPLFYNTDKTTPVNKNLGYITNERGVKVETVISHSSNHKRVYVTREE